MENKCDGKFFAKLDIHEYFQLGPFETREECEKKARAEWFKTDSMSGKFEIGKLDGYVPTIDWTADNINEQAADYGGYDSDYPNMSKPQSDRLDYYLTECLHKWMEENKIDFPNFGLIKNVEKHKL